MEDGGVAVLEMGQSFGGGSLQFYGINSNTSANGFLKCAFNKSYKVSFTFKLTNFDLGKKRFPFSDSTSNFIE